MGAGDDRQIRVDPCCQGRADLAAPLIDADQVGGLAPELRREAPEGRGCERNR
jgi:hypothetical protein